MKIYYSLFLALTLTFSITAQKKELKAAQKLVDAKTYGKALELLMDNAETLKTAEPKYASHFYYLKGVVEQGNQKFSDALASYDKAKSIEKDAGLNKYSQLINAANANLIGDIVNHAVSLNTKEDFIGAGNLLYMAYSLDKSNVDYLYYAASSLVNGGDYDNSLSYYLKLKELNYTGVTKKYYATEVSTNEEIEVNKATYDIYKKSKDFTNLREGLSPSRLPEVVKNIALIYVNQEDTEAAMASIKDARKLSPKDVGLILTEADLYIKIGDEARFATLMKEAIDQDPTNAILYYNLGVVSGNKGNRDGAIGYYKKAIELDPEYEATYLNLASVILEGESIVVEQMNALGTSSADNKKYEELKIKREGLYLEAVPYLEQVIKLNPKNADAMTTLKNIYGTIGDTANFKKYREMLDSL